MGVLQVSSTGWVDELGISVYRNPKSRLEAQKLKGSIGNSLLYKFDSRGSQFRSTGKPSSRKAYSLISHPESRASSLQSPMELPDPEAQRS